MKIRVQLFALARELAGEDVVELELPSDATVAELRAALVAAAAPLAELVPHSAVAIDACYATNLTPIEPGAEIVLIPPVSGG